MSKEKYNKELEFCLNLWETKGGCTFGGRTRCEGCGAPYLLWKLLTGEVVHGDIERLSLKDWQSKFNSLN